MNGSKDKKQNVPYIHLFRTVSGAYLYDVNRDKAVPVPDGVYRYLEDEQRGICPVGEPPETLEFIEQLKMEGYLKTKRVSAIKHHRCDMMSCHIRHKVRHVILQVTQRCNLRCEYCVYSGDYHNRRHSNKNMSFEVAKKAMDYYISHSSDTGELSIGFYGGEPCLNFDLIQKCVDYMDKEAEGRVVKYNMTTNATLLTDKILRFLVDHQFSLMISLDGTRETHNRHRKFAADGKGSYDVVIKNIERLKEQYPEYARSCVQFNCVIDPEYSFASIEEAIENSPVLADMKFRSTTINVRNTDKKYCLSDAYMEEVSYEKFKIQLELLGELPPGSGSKLLNHYKSTLKKSLENADGEGNWEIPDEWHHGGPCLPGTTRLFVNVEGDFYPCERVNEDNPEFKIGNVETGIDINAAEAILNFDRDRIDICRNCWAFLRCNQCISYLEGKDGAAMEKRIQYCKETRRSVEEDLKDACVLKDLGCNYLILKNR